ncbi:MAG: hypothetical protein IKY12_01150 [Clostridia bacterium]|nr:hypothetical protein [Clostridia bacterium]
MRIYENGIYRDMTEAEMLELQNEKTEYKERVVSRIREKYSVDDEIAILRQRYTKPEEFSRYNAFVEGIKGEERNV